MGACPYKDGYDPPSECRKSLVTSRHKPLTDMSISIITNKEYRKYAMYSISMKTSTIKEITLDVER